MEELATVVTTTIVQTVLTTVAQTTTSEAAKELGVNPTIIAAAIAFSASIITMFVSILNTRKSRKSDASFRQAEMDHKIRMENRAQINKVYCEIATLFSSYMFILEEMAEAEEIEKKRECSNSMMQGLEKIKREIYPLLCLFSTIAVAQSFEEALNALAECLTSIANNVDELREIYGRSNEIITDKYLLLVNEMRKDLRIDLR